MFSVFPSKNRRAKVTVCVPTFNHEMFIEHAIRSVVEQNVEDIDIIVANDGSTDRTLEIVRNLQGFYPDKISIIHHAQNVGLSCNVESIYSCIQETTKFICWFSGDDIMFPGKLKRQIEYLEDENLVFCYHDCLVSSSEKNKGFRYNSLLFGQKPFEGKITEKLVERGCFVSGLSVLINWEKGSCVKHRSDMSVYSDWLYFIELSMLGDVGYIPEVLGVYRKHSDSVTNNVVEFSAPKKILEFLRSEYNYPESAIDKSIINIYSSFALRLLYRMRFSEACGCLLLALKSCGLRPKMFAFFVLSNAIFICRFFSIQLFRYRYSKK